MKGDFYNTIKERDAQLEKTFEKTERQEDRVLELFMFYPDRSFTPFEVLHRIFSGQRVPITSVRRALTNLTESNLLEKTEEMAVEHFGKKNHKWRLAKSQPQDQLALTF